MRWNAIAELISNIKNPIGVEVGVLYCKTSIELLKRPDLFLYMVDPYYKFDEDTDYYKSGDLTPRLSKEELEKMYLEAKAISEKNKNSKLLRKFSEEAAKQFKDSSLDFVFIDANHTYEACLKDIKTWYPKLKKGGFLIGHDYGSKKHVGVKKAWDEFSNDFKYTLRFKEDKIVWLKKEAYTICSAFYGNDPEYMFLKDIFVDSVYKNTSATLKVEEGPVDLQGKSKIEMNYLKLKLWFSCIQGVKGNIVLSDTDLIFLDDIDEVFESNFDIALTKLSTKYKYNGGVIFIKNSNKIEQLFNVWLKEDEKVLNNSAYRTALQIKYKVPGQNQVSLLSAMESQKLKVKWVPCAKYNCPPFEINNFSSATKVIHIKSALRNMCTGRYPIKEKYKNAVAKVQELYPDILNGFATNKPNIISGYRKLKLKIRQ